MTEEQKSALRRLVEAATPGPWVAGRYSVTLSESPHAWSVAECHHGLGAPDEEALVNAAFIAAARTAIPDLLAENERLLKTLADIADLQPEPYAFPADWQDQIAACRECAQYKGHPIQQGICDTHRKPLWARDAHERNEVSRIGPRAQRLAREALYAAATEKV